MSPGRMVGGPHLSHLLLAGHRHLAWPEAKVRGSLPVTTRADGRRQGTTAHMPWGALGPQLRGTWGTAEDNEPRGQRPFGAIDLGWETAGLGFHTAEATGPRETLLYDLKRRPAGGRCAAVLGRRPRCQGRPHRQASGRTASPAARAYVDQVAPHWRGSTSRFARRVLEPAPRRGAVDSAGWAEIARGPSGVEGPKKVRPAMSRRHNSTFGELFSSHPSTPDGPRAGYPPFGPGGATPFGHRPASGEPVRSNEWDYTNPWDATSGPRMLNVTGACDSARSLRQVQSEAVS
jgi:hypothetical protein